jgi:predicted PurR-regulated permease PerM
MAYLVSKVLQTERRTWYLHDVVKPVFISMLVAVPFYLIHQYLELSTLAAVTLCGICIITCFFATVMLGTPALKPEIKSFIQKIRVRKS